ncbi:MAG: UDP-glucose dehydrogenase family protein, partial [Bdellovibrionales bacterium]
MKVSVFGTGYVGLVTGTCLAETGNSVIAFDIDKSKIENLKEGHIPIYEKGLEDMVRSNLSSKRLIFTDSSERAVKESDILIIAVGTPPNEDGSADLNHVLAVARSIGQKMESYKLIVNKSTVPVGTADLVKKTIQEELNRRSKKIEFSVASNPEFLKEGSAVADFMKPDRILIGCEPSDEKAEKMLRELYQSFVMNGYRFIVMDLRSAELCKYASNAMLATKISFMNELSRISEELGADIMQVRQGMGADKRIGYEFTHAGLGYGGSCFPKDVNALTMMARDRGLEASLLKAVEHVNDSQRLRFIQKIKNHYSASNKKLEGLQFGIWGLSFKPDTDDIRMAPSLDVIAALIKAGAKVVAYDPISSEHVKKYFAAVEGSVDRSKLLFASDMYEALSGADAMILCTEWKFFRSPDFDKMKSLM